MGRIGKVLSKFYGGEFSQWLRGQYDLSAFNYALEELVNTNVQIYGPLTRRMGTVLVSASSAKVNGVLPATRLIPFTVDENTVYVLVLTANAAGTIDMTVLRPDGSFVMQDSSTKYTLKLPYQQKDMMDLHYAQSSDILFIVHPSYAPRQLSHYGPTNWTIEVMEINDGPYFTENANEAKKLTLSAKTGSNVKVTATQDMFSDKDVGRYIRIKHKPDAEAKEEAEGKDEKAVSTWGYGRITKFIDAKTVEITVKRKFVSKEASYEWRLGAFGDAPGYPRTVTFHQERLWFGGTKSQPQTVWSSKSSDFNNYEPSDKVGDVLDDSSIVLTMLSDETNAIQWLKSDVVLNVGTVGAEFKIFTFSSESVLTPTTAQAQRVTTYGSERIEPVSLPIGTVFVQRSGRRLRHAIFTNSLNNDETPADLNIWATHIADKGIKQIVYQKEPNNIIWAITSDGQLAGLTYEPSQKVMAWARHKPAGKNVEVQRVCCIPYKEALQYRLFLVVDRELGGVKTRCIEFLGDEINDITKQEEMVYTDASYFTKWTTETQKLYYNEATGLLKVYTLNDTSKRRRRDNVRGIYQATFADNGVPIHPDTNLAPVKFLNIKKYEPDILTTEWSNSRKLSDMLKGKLLSLEIIPDESTDKVTAWKVKTGYGKELGDEFKGCLNDVTDLGYVYSCIEGWDSATELAIYEGEEIQVVGDGAVLENQLVTGGSLNLNNSYACVNIGLGYRSVIKTMPIVNKSDTGEITNMWTLKIVKAYVHVYKSLGFKYGVEMNNLSVEPFRNTREPMDAATPLYTGIKDITTGDVTDNKGQIIIVQDQPLPLNVLSIGLKVDASDV